MSGWAEALAAASAAEIATAALLLGGAAFCAIAAVGLLRLPDVLMRMHASTKAGTLGAGLILIGAAAAFDDTGVTARALGAVAFLLLTAPVAAHVIGRAAYLGGAPLSARTWIDERRAPPASPGASPDGNADAPQTRDEAETRRLGGGPSAPPVSGGPSG